MGYYDHAGKNKDCCISEWKCKGVEWCANQLWIARRERSKLKTELNARRFGRNASEAEEDILRTVNENLRKLLKKEGVKVKKIVVEFEDGYCTNNLLFPGGYCDQSNGCDVCPTFRDARSVKTFSFYTWEVNDGLLTGITKEFKTKTLDVIRVVDEDTMTVLYEADKEEEK